MPGVARVGIDEAGGQQLGGGQDFVRVEGALVVVVGDQVAGHGEHGGPVMAEGSDLVRIAGKAVCRAGDQASCGHATTGGDFVAAE